MAPFADHSKTIIRLHELGFTEDFVLFGEELYWIQEKLFLRQTEFTLVLCLEVNYPNAVRHEELVILGVHALPFGTKGILMNHYTFSQSSPPVITRKLSEMGFYSKKLADRMGAPTEDRVLIQSTAYQAAEVGVH